MISNINLEKSDKFGSDIKQYYNFLKNIKPSKNRKDLREIYIDDKIDVYQLLNDPNNDEIENFVNEDLQKSKKVIDYSKNDQTKNLFLNIMLNEKLDFFEENEDIVKNSHCEEIKNKESKCISPLFSTIKVAKILKNNKFNFKSGVNFPVLKDNFGSNIQPKKEISEIQIRTVHLISYIIIRKKKTSP